MPANYSSVGVGVSKALFNLSDTDFQAGLQRWLEGLGQIRNARFFVTEIEPEGGSRWRVLIRYEVSSQRAEELQYRVGYWRQSWSDDRLVRFEPIQETLAASPQPLFKDVTWHAFRAVNSYHQQMLRGVPYWRARLDSASGIDVYGNNGIAVGDVDGDGWDEIYICQPGGLPNRLYKNRGDGSLEDITERAGIDLLDDTSSALFLDLRNSGLQDLVVLRSAGPLLFLNQGGGRFRCRLDAFRFAMEPQGTLTGMAAADYDGDGRLDLYLCCYVYFQSEDQYLYPVPYHDAQNGPPNFLFHNQLNVDGSGVFEDVTQAAGLHENSNRYSFAPAWCDYDGDGWPDLYVANDFGRNNLYKNERGRFRDVAASAGVEDIGPGMSTAWFDYDGDGLPDLYVGNMWTAAGQRIIHQKQFPPTQDEALKPAYQGHTKGNSLYRNRGNGTFEYTGAAEGVEMGRWSWSADAHDFDNDGSPEIYVTTGMITNISEKDLASFFWRQVVARTPTIQTAAPAYETGWNALNQLIREDYSWNGRELNVFYARRNGRYYDFSGVSGLDCADDSRAFAVTDLDGDGNLDLVLKSRLAPQVRVFRNQCGTARHALVIRLIGTRSNRDAIGARVQVDIFLGKERSQITKFVQAGSGYLSQHTKLLYFGLGETKAASVVRVRWPSGLEQEFLNLPAGFRHEIVEGTAEIKSTPFLGRKPMVATDTQSEAIPQVDNMPGMSETWLLEPLPLPEKRKGPAFLYLVAGQSVRPPAGLPFEIVDLTKESPDRAAFYSLFRRYLFDWRAQLTLPLLLLIDERGRAHKIYPAMPEPAELRADLNRLDNSNADSARQQRALPFPGRYYTAPHRKYFQLGTAFFWAGYPEQALPYLSEVVRQSPVNFKALLAIGQIHLQLGRHQIARQYLERALAINPQSPEAWNNLGGVEEAGGNYAAALANYQKALAIQPDLPYVLVNAGQAYVKLGNTEAAEKMFRRVLEIDANDADVANQLGLLLARQDRADEARRYFQQAIALKRDHVGAINNLAVLYSQTHQFNDAVAAFQYGIEVAPDADNLYLNLARLYVSMGDRNKAREVMRRLLSRQPNNPAAIKALEMLGDR